MQIAVTGASGHIGNVVCRILINNGYKVKAFYNSDMTSLADLDIELIQGNVININDLSVLIEDCEVVINCAAIISINGDPKANVLKTNTEGPRNILKVSIKKGVRRIIHISSVHAVSELPHSLPYNENRPYKTKNDYVYDYSKALGEQILLEEAKNTSVEIIIIRPSCVMGPFDFKPSKMGKVLIDFYNQRIPALPFGGYDFVDVRDVAKSIIDAIHNGKNAGIYLLSGKYYDLKTLSKIIKKVTGKNVPQIVMPYSFLKALVPFYNLYYKLFNIAPSLTFESIDALKNGHPNMDNTKAKMELGFNCRPIEESLSDFYLWQKNNLN